MCCKELREALGGKEECYSHSTAAKENGKEFRLKNSSGQSVCRAKIDSCVIDSSAIVKCDYLFKSCESGLYFLVELKGTDVTHAVSQISNTYLSIRKKVKEKPENFKGYIISSSVPAAEQKFRSLKERALRDHKLEIFKRTGKCEVII